MAFVFGIVSWGYYREIQKEKASTHFFVHHFWRWVLAGVFLGRVMAILLDLEIFQQYGWFSLIAFWDGGINFFGAILGFLLLLYHDTVHYKESFWQWADMGTRFFLLGVIGFDIIAFLTGKVYGIETKLPWSVSYESFSIPVFSPVHPVTLYALILHVMLFWWLYRNEIFRKTNPAKIFTTVFFGYFVANFFILFFVGNPSPQIGIIRMDQIFSLLGAVMVWNLAEKNNVNLPWTYLVQKVKNWKNWEK